MMPMVSVVIATFQREFVLKRALDSLSAQTYTDFEIIVVDDNGNNEWSKKVNIIVDEFRQTCPQFELQLIVNQFNIGSAQSRNAGISVSRGEYICFLDDDDFYRPDRLKNQLVPMQQTNADYSITDLELYSEAGRLIETRTRDYIKDTSVESLSRYHLMYHITGTDTMMFRKDYLLKIGCFSPIDVGDEFYLMHKAIEGGGKFLYVPVCDVQAYVHVGENGLSSGKRKINGENMLFEYKKHYFKTLNRNEIKYIKMRHHAVLAFAYLRSKHYLGFATEATKSFISSPTACMNLLRTQ